MYEDLAVAAGIFASPSKPSSQHASSGGTFFMSALTERQGQVLDFIADRLEGGGGPPSHDEIAEEFDVARQTASGHVAVLEVKGYLDKDSRRHRSMTLTDYAWRRQLACAQRQGARAQGLGRSDARTLLTLRQCVRALPQDQRQLALEFAAS